MEKLYDRQGQLDQLVQAYRRRVGTTRNNSPTTEKPAFAELILVNGSSGSGKTELAKAFGRQIMSSCYYANSSTTGGMGGSATTPTGMFLAGKFPQSLMVGTGQTTITTGTTTSTHCDVPLLAPFREAFEQFTNYLLVAERSGNSQQQQQQQQVTETMREMIQVVVGSELNLLLEILPSLRQLFHGTSSSAFIESSERSSTTTDASSSSDDDYSATSFAAHVTRTATTPNRENRIIIVLRRLIRAITHCSSNNTDGRKRFPLVIFLDDLQWADQLSLNLIGALVAPSLDNHPGLMIVGSCRGDEVAPTDPLSVLLRDLENQGTKITEIVVSNLSHDSLWRMIHDVTGRPWDLCASMADQAYRQTGGNPLFVKEYLRGYLSNDNKKKKTNRNSVSSTCTDANNSATVERSEEEEQVWNAQDSTDDTDNDCLPFLVDRMRKLPVQVQEVLMVAAILGGELIRESLVCWAMREEADYQACLGQVRQAFCVCVENNILEYNFDTCIGRFLHDKIQEAAFLMIPEQERALFQLRLGTNLLRNARRSRAKHDTPKNLLPMAVSLMLCGKTELQFQSEKDELAALCLEAGKVMTKSSAFFEAIHYVEEGICLLSSTHWDDHYELSLRLYSAAAELAYCKGCHSKVDDLVQVLRDNVRTFEDGLQAEITMILSLGSRGLNEQAGVLGIKALRMLRETVPRKVGRIVAMMQVYKVQKMVRAMCDDDILNLPQASDSRALAVMSILHVLYPIAVMSHIEYTTIISCRLIVLTLQYGLCSFSSVAFAYFGSALARMGNVSEGCRLGELSLKIMEKHPTKELMARALQRVGLHLRIFKDPFRVTVETLSEAHRLGMMTGDIETAMFAASSACGVRCYIGESLSSVSKIAKQYIDLCNDYGQHMIGNLLRPVQQFCCNLMGRAAGNPLILTGEAMDEKRLVKEAHDEHNTGLQCIVLFLKYALAAYLNELAYAESISNQLRLVMDGKHPFIPMVWTFHCFYEGLVSVARAMAYRKPSVSRNRELRLAQQRLKSIREVARHCPENMMNKVHLLQGDLAACNGKYDQAELEYRQSIVFAEHEGFISEQALACEKMARMLKGFGQSDKAKTYFLRALALYDTYGATILVDKITKELESCRSVASDECLDNTVTRKKATRVPFSAGCLVPVISEADLTMDRC